MINLIVKLQTLAWCLASVWRLDPNQDDHQGETSAVEILKLPPTK